MADLEIMHGPVQTMNKKDIPLPNETIEDDINIDELSKVISSFNVYSRSKEECPWNRGNWIIDFFSSGNPFPMFSLKLPIIMTKEALAQWLLPLREKIKMEQK